MTSTGAPAMCRRCGFKPRAFIKGIYCLDCLPGGPHVAPPCRRCGSVTAYYASGLCQRCHFHAPPVIDSCRNCLAWGVTRRHGWLCKACNTWCQKYKTYGPCLTCGHPSVLADNGSCRLCHKQGTLWRQRGQPMDLAAANRHGQQLFIANLFIERGAARTRPVPLPPPTQPARRLACYQMVLFPWPRDLSCGLRKLPDPPDSALAAELETFTREHAARHGWSKSVTDRTRYGIRVLLAFQDIPGAQITNSEAAVLKGSGLPIRTVTDVLAAAGMLRDDRIPAVETWFTRHTAGLPEQMRAELQIWFEVMAYGSRTPPRRLPRTHATIRLQLSFALPALRAWAEAGHQSLREISRADVIAILPVSRNPRALMGQGLRSIFRLLKTRKVTFTDPTARIPIGYPAPREPLPADLAALRQALDSPDPVRAALTALVAFHGLRGGQLRELQLTDIRDGRLHLGGRAVVLASTVQERLTAYLGYRASRWPHTANPHLFLSQRTATRTGPVGNRWIKLKIGISGATQAIREDRILDEAHATNGDARRLCDLFGLSMTAAERYIATVSHPDLIGKANTGA